MDVLQRLAAVGKPRVEPIEIDGQVFHVRGMGSLQRAVFLQCTQQAVLENSAVPDHTVVSLGLCNEDGTPLGKASEELLADLQHLDGQILYQLARRIIELSGFGKKALETAEKN